MFKGRKRGQYENPAFDNIATKGDSRACIVSEEQINAWLRINGKKPFTDVAVKSLSSPDVELDLQVNHIPFLQFLIMYFDSWSPGVILSLFWTAVLHLKVVAKHTKHYSEMHSSIILLFGQPRPWSFSPLDRGLFICLLKDLLVCHNACIVKVKIICRAYNFSA